MAAAAAAAAATLSVPDQIRQLEGARKLVLGDVSYYSQVIQATLPIIGPSAQVEFRRWGADFLSEAFATPAVTLSQKETLSLLVFETLKRLVADPSQDVMVLRGVIQTVASIYPLGLRWMINNAYDTATWERMTAIKTNILRIWDTAPPTIRICCIKFAQRVILAQTPSISPEPRRGDPLDISLNMIPPNHAVLDPNALEAEASGLLDRMLGTLQENSSDALAVDATLNALSVLIRGRPSTSNRVLNAVLSFNPFILAGPQMSSKTKVMIKSMEKTTRILLIHLSRRDPNNPQLRRIQEHIERLMRSRADILDETSRKRAMMDEADGLDGKRQRLNASQQLHLQVTPLKPGSHSLAELFTLINNPDLQSFNVSLVPAPLAAKISVNTIARADPQLLERAITGVRDRLGAMFEAGREPINPETTPLGVEDDEDDYEPDYYAAEDTEQILNKLDSSPEELRDRESHKPALDSLALPAFRLPPPPSVDPEQAAKVGQGTIMRVFGMMRTLDDPASKKTRAGINRLASSSYDRDAWLTVITRLATRVSAGLDEEPIKEADSASLSRPNLPTTIRESLYAYILEDFRNRINSAISWLSEEWFNDRIRQHQFVSSQTSHRITLYYEKWALRLIDGFVPYLHTQDNKFLVRFLSEIPELNVAILSRVKGLCRDPSMVTVAIQSLLYLVMFRLPVRNMALDMIQEIWTDYEEARPIAAKSLARWRPGFLESAERTDGNGIPVGGGTALAAS